jgi:hypothetical protein
MALILDYFSESRIALNEELPNHPELCELIAKHPASEFELRIAEIAAYCELALDGYYSQEDLDKICDILVRKLKAKNSIIILPH